MDAFELLKGWPGWSNANAERVLASPAWRMPVEFDGDAAEMTAATGDMPDPLWLDVTFDDERHLLGVSDSEQFPDLHLLWGRRGGLPPEVLLALAERECGAVFQMLENATGRTVALKGIAEDAAAGAGRSRTFAVTRQGGETPGLILALDMSSALNMAFGQLKYVDTNHPEIRSMAIPAQVEYASFDISEVEFSRLAAGDFLLCGGAPTATWRYGSEPAQGVRAFDAQPRELTFGQIADDRLPEAPAPELLSVRGDGGQVAEGVFDRVVGHEAVRIVRIVRKEG